MLFKILNNSGSSEEVFSHMSPFGLNIDLTLLWPFGSRSSSTFLVLGALKPCMYGISLTSQTVYAIRDYQYIVLNNI